METLILGGKTLSLVTTISNIGTDVIVGSLKLATTGIITGIGKIVKSSNPYSTEIISLLSDMDIVNRLAIINDIINEHVSDDAPESLKKAIMSTTSVLNEIHNQVNVIQQKLEEHNNMWFKSMRSLNCTVDIETIKKNMLLFQSRYELLKDTIILNKKK